LFKKGGQVKSTFAKRQMTIKKISNVLLPQLTRKFTKKITTIMAGINESANQSNGDTVIKEESFMMEESS
jgi:hypothetical protein